MSYNGDFDLMQPRSTPRNRRKQDKLDKCAERAAAMGMSYGQYMGLLHEGRLPAEEMANAQQILARELLKEPKPETVAELKHAGPRAPGTYPMRQCGICGAEFRPRASNGKYCSDTCRTTAAWRQAVTRKAMIKSGCAKGGQE